jgi:hypothetical protein
MFRAQNRHLQGIRIQIEIILFLRLGYVVGAAGCLNALMIIAISILFAIFHYLRRTAAPARLADISRAYHLQRTRANLLDSNISPEYPRDWRPQILAFSEDPDRRPPLLRLASWLEGGSGLTLPFRFHGDLIQHPVDVRAEKAEKEAAGAREVADSAEERLDKALAKQISDPDEKLISKLKADRDKAIKAAEKGPQKGCQSTDQGRRYSKTN